MHGAGCCCYISCGIYLSADRCVVAANRTTEEEKTFHAGGCRAGGKEEKPKKKKMQQKKGNDDGRRGHTLTEMAEDFVSTWRNTPPTDIDHCSQPPSFFFHRLFECWTFLWAWPTPLKLLSIWFYFSRKDWNEHFSRILFFKLNQFYPCIWL